MSGFAHDENDIELVYSSNVDFSGGVTPTGQILSNGQMLIGTTAVNAGGTHINVGTITSPSATLTIGYSSPNITLDLAGGSMGIDSVAVDTGISPVLPTGAGLITFNGAVVAAGTNPVRTDGTGANTYALEVQISQAIAGADATKLGLSNFDSSSFAVAATGFVTLSTTGAGKTITGDSGGALPPTSNNWDIIGQKASTIPVMTTTGSGSILSIEDRTRISAFVVDPSSTAGLRGTYTTIQSAITAVSAGQTIYVRPGIYTENLTMKAGITICGMTGDAYNNSIIIIGTITCTYSGRSTLTGLNLQATTSNGIILSGAAGTELIVKGCTIYQYSQAGVHYSYQSSNNANSVKFYDCYFDTDAFGAWFDISAGRVQLLSCLFVNSGGSIQPNLMSGGEITLSNTTYGIENTILMPWTVSGGIFSVLSSTLNGGVTTSGTSSLEVNNSRIFYTGVCFTVGGSGTNNIFNSTIYSSTFSSISVDTARSCNIGGLLVESTNASPITGAGTIYYGGISFVGPSVTSLMDTSIQIPSIKSNDAIKVKTPGVYPYTTVPQDALILVDSSSARTIVPLASPTTGQVHTIKDNSGLAATNNITVTPSGKNIDGSASYIISTNYASMTIVYNGTQWNII